MAEPGEQQVIAEFKVSGDRVGNREGGGGPLLEKVCVFVSKLKLYTAYFELIMFCEKR
jgi:hypothetical protein